jgi:hypothetical protein
MINVHHDIVYHDGHDDDDDDMYLFNIYYLLFIPWYLLHKNIIRI